MAADCYFPIGQAEDTSAQGKFQGNIRGYWEWANDPRYMNIYYDEAVTEENNHRAVTTGNTWTSAAAGAGANTTNGDQANELLYSLKAQTKVEDDFWVQVVLP